MTRIKLYDSLFAHASTMGNGNRRVIPDGFEWHRGGEHTKISVYTDQNLEDVTKPLATNDSDIKVALLMESPEIYPEPYQKVVDLRRKFDYILTFDTNTLTSLSNSLDYGKAKPRLYYLGGCWIDEPAIYPKTKNISIIVSDKTTTRGHKLRHEIVQSLADKVDVYGRGYRPIPDKLEALRDYRFTIVVENCRRDFYFTEKLIDAFATGTIPIYWGCPGIFDVFGHMSLLPFDTMDELRKIVDMISVCPGSYYEGSMQSVQGSFEASKRFWVTENWLWRHFFKEICG
jgi:hypothetical protein